MTSTQIQLSSSSSTIQASATQSTSAVENYAGTVQSTTNSANLDTLHSYQAQASVASSYNVPPPLPVQHPINFNVPPPIINNSLLPLNTSLSSVVNRSNTETWVPKSNVIMPDLSAPPPLIINHQISLSAHQKAASVHNLASPTSNESVISTDLLPPPGASSTSSSSTSPSSSSSSSNRSGKHNKNNVKNSNEFDNAWETLLKRTEGVSYIYKFFFIILNI